MSWRKLSLILLVLLVLSLGLDAYLYWTIRGIEEKMTTVHVKIGTMKAFSYLPIHVAYALGYFKDEGLDVELVFFGSGSKNREALIAGDVDFSSLATVHILIARGKGCPVKIIGALQNMEFFDLLVRNDLRGKVKELKDLKGLRVGISAPGSGSWAWCVVYLKKAGLDPDKDVKLVSVDGVMTMYSALKAKKVDAVIAWNPLTVRAIKEGLGFVLINVHDRETHLKYVGSEEALSGVLATSEDFIEKRPDIVIKVIKAVNRGLKYIQTHSPEEIAKAVASIYEGLDLDTLTEAIRYEMPTYPRNLAVSESAFNVEAETYLSVGIIKEEIGYAEAVEWSLTGWRP